MKGERNRKRKIIFSGEELMISDNATVGKRVINYERRNFYFDRFLARFLKPMRAVIIETRNCAIVTVCPGRHSVWTDCWLSLSHEYFAGRRIRSRTRATRFSTRKTPRISICFKVSSPRNFFVVCRIEIAGRGSRSRRFG